MEHSGTALLDPQKIFSKIGLTAGMRVADFGCGRTGHFVFPAAKAVGERGMVYAVDILKEVLESIQSWIRSEGMDNIQTVWSDIEAYAKTPIPEKSLDVCFLVNVLHGLKDRVGTLKEAKRLLKDDGQLVIVDWEKKLGTLGPVEQNMMSIEKVVELITQVGLRSIDTMPVNDYHFCVICKKA